MIVPAVIAAVLLALPAAPARGDSNVALVHVVGLHRIASADRALSWEFAPAAQDWAFTLPAGEWVEVAVGSCTIDGVTHRPMGRQRAYCYGSGG